jgi:endogenous inhibitor of DNA gyrase (YacG/DUF329 family)
MESLMTPRNCAHCGQSFQPRPQVPNQTYCSSPKCQRARKLRWQQNKLRTDPDYRDDQRKAQRKWLDKKPDYWRTYRAGHPNVKKRHQKLAINSASNEVAKMDASILPPGLYRLRRIAPLIPEKNGDWLVEITPVR